MGEPTLRSLAGRCVLPDGTVVNHLAAIRAARRRRLMPLIVQTVAIALLAVVVLLVVFAVAAPRAHAWTVEVRSNVVTLTRSAEDTSACSVTLYTDAKTTTDPSNCQYASAYNVNRGQWNMESATRSLSLPVRVGSYGAEGGWNLLSIKVGSTTTERHAVYLTPEPVSQSGGWVQSVTNTVPVTLDESQAISIDTTIGANIGSVAGLSPETIVGLAAFFVTGCGVALGFAFVGGRRR